MGFLIVGWLFGFVETSVTEAGLGLAVDEYDLERLILLLSRGAKIADMPTVHGLYIWCWDSTHMALCTIGKCSPRGATFHSLHIAFLLHYLSSGDRRLGQKHRSILHKVKHS